MEESTASEQLSPAELFLQSLYDRLEAIGDLPIFSASVARIQTVGSDPDSNAVCLASEVLKDANLTTKILKLANSIFYSRSPGKIGTLSRAIVMLGFDLVKNTVVTLKLIDSFNSTEAGCDIENLLIRSYLSAAMTRKCAELAGLKNPEQSYICGLLHQLGEIVLHATMPEKCNKIKQLMEKEGLGREQAVRRVLPLSLYQIGQAVAEHWEFPQSTYASMRPRQKQFNKRVTKVEDFNQAVSSLTADMMELLYVDDPNCKDNLGAISQELANVCGSKEDVIIQALLEAFSQSSDLAESYGLKREALAPLARTRHGENDELREQIAEQMRQEISILEPEQPDLFFADDHDDDGYDAEASEVLEADAQSSGNQTNTEALLAIIQQISMLITQGAPINAVFDKCMQGMVDGLGFDRAILCLLTPDRKHYSGRVAYGARHDQLREYFRNRKVSVDSDVFSHIMMKGIEGRVQNVNQSEYKQFVHSNKIEVLPSKHFVVSALSVREKSVGLFYADCAVTGVEPSHEQYRGFLQLVGQAQLALQIR